MITTNQRMGEFDTVLCGLARFDARDLQAESRFHGLQPNETLMLAHVRDRSGRQLHLTRPVTLFTSNGLSFSVSRDDGIYQDPRGREFLRGGNFSRGVNQHGELTLSGNSGFWAGAAPETVEGVFGERVAWNDSGRFHAAGRLLGPGTQMYAPWRRGEFAGGTGHSAMFWEVDGELFGEPVSGFVILEHFFSPPGQVLGDSALRRRLIGGWTGFATVFEDGPAQYGNLGFGLGPWRFANIVDGDRHIACRIDAAYPELRADGRLDRIEYHLANGEKWEFVPGDDGALIDMINQARKLGTKAEMYKGRINRVGEARNRRSWYAIQEWIADRFKPDASDIDEEPPKGY